MGDHGLPKRIVSGVLENLRQRALGGGEGMDGMRGRGSPDIWHDRGLKSRRTRLRGLEHRSMLRELQL